MYMWYVCMHLSLRKLVSGRKDAEALAEQDMNVSGSRKVDQKASDR